MASDNSNVNFRPSKLGTKSHWDSVYEEELKNFEEIGDEGEVWFGEESVEKMVDWALENVIDSSSTMLEVGSGNGTLLFALKEAGYNPLNLYGIDYSTGAVDLARSIAKSRGEGYDDITFSVRDFLSTASEPKDGEWDIIMDKGTYDAIALGEKDDQGRSPAYHYPPRIRDLLKPGGIFLITSCNFTEEELKASFITPETGLKYHSRIQHPVFTFGGKSGSIVSSVAFQKPATSS